MIFFSPSRGEGKILVVKGLVKGDSSGKWMMMTTMARMIKGTG